MNTQASTGFQSASPASPTEETQPGRTARFLRILGALAIGGSGLLYMLQGLYNTDTDLRSWVYLALMTALGAGGIFSLRLMQDSKGARLFFALAALLIPVQFSQLGAMTLSLVTGTSTALEWYTISTPATASFLLIGALSLLMAIALSFAAFSVLARAAAKPLSFVFIVMNTLLLLPFRDSFATLPILAALFALTVFLEMRIFRHQLIFQTLEGAGVRIMMLLPLTIAVCRNAFHLSDTLGISAMLGVSGFILHYLAACQVTPISSRYVREIFGLLSFICLLPASLASVHELFDHSRGLLLPLEHQWYSVIYTLPVLACTLYFSTRSTLLSLFYQFAACAALCIGIAWVLDGNHTAAEFALWSAAITTLCHGMVRRQKIVFVAGALTSIGLGGHLLYTATRDIHINLWLMLAVGGLMLMVLSSVCEKHGRKWLHNSREYWREFSEWEAR